MITPICTGHSVKPVKTRTGTGFHGAVFDAATATLLVTRPRQAQVFIVRGWMAKL